MGIKQDLRRVAGVALVIAGGIAVPSTAQAQVSVGVDGGDVAQVSTSSSSTGLAIGQDMRAASADSATALDVAGVGGERRAGRPARGRGLAGGRQHGDDLTVQVAGVAVVLDDKLVDRAHRRRGRRRRHAPRRVDRREAAS